ncbi:GNAT family N-acetyltransferase [Sphingomonas sp. SUN039]|uniref:GNAT family N-acetyltransferase n=1 Tax=Sphingomonas sp. SUN039 TaxID=2937787 RepID=UPI0021647544|nr:GNAT family N-acetyltransferase [Sphingomonas sp. SUN039]UVO54410.1 GNAT family N-acetyltransferase [Sphingomonas sp. SUN039]
MFIRTENLLLRPGWTEDAPELYAAIAREEVAYTLARLPWPYTLDHARAWLDRPRAADDAHLLIYERTGNAPRLIGGIGLAPDGHDVELGYWIVPSHWGRGFATEAGRAVIAMARDTLRLDRLVSGHFVENPASGRVLRKLGFAATGTTDLRYCLARDAMLPCVGFSLDLEPMRLAA